MGRAIAPFERPVKAVFNLDYFPLVMMFLRIPRTDIIGKFTSILRPFSSLPSFTPNQVEMDPVLTFGGKNSRKPNRANHGARPCSSYMRRLKRRELFGRFKSNEGGEEMLQVPINHVHDDAKRELQEEAEEKNAK